MTKVTTVGLDLAKSVFQVHGADQDGRPVVRKKLRRAQVIPFFADLAPCLIGMETPCHIRPLRRCRRGILGQARLPEPYRRRDRTDYLPQRIADVGQAKHSQHHYA